MLRANRIANFVRSERLVLAMKIEAELTLGNSRTAVIVCVAIARTSIRVVVRGAFVFPARRVPLFL